MHTCRNMDLGKRKRSITINCMMVRKERQHGGSTPTYYPYHNSQIQALLVSGRSVARLFLFALRRGRRRRRCLFQVALFNLVFITNLNSFFVFATVFFYIRNCSLSKLFFEECLWKGSVVVEGKRGGGVSQLFRFWTFGVDLRLIFLLSPQEYFSIVCKYTVLVVVAAVVVHII